MDIRDKLAQLLPHWTEHNESHIEQLEEWADRARAAEMGEVAELIGAAAISIKQANAELATAKRLLSA